MALRILKFLVVAGILILFRFLPGVNVSWSAIVVTTLVLGFSGLMGDRTLMPKMSNLVSCITDVGMAFAITWIVIGLAPKSTVSFTYLLLVSISYGVFEYVYHQWLYPRGFYEGRQS